MYCILRNLLLVKKMSPLWGLVAISRYYILQWTILHPSAYGQQYFNLIVQKNESKIIKEYIKLGEEYASGCWRDL